MADLIDGDEAGFGFEDGRSLDVGFGGGEVETGSDGGGVDEGDLLGGLEACERGEGEGEKGRSDKRSSRRARTERDPARTHP